MLKEVLQHPDYIPQYLSMSAFLFLSQSLPLEASLKLGAMSGLHMRRYTKRNTDIAFDNIRKAFPGISDERAMEIVVGIYKHFGRASAEVAMAHRLIRPSTWRRHIEVRNEHVFRDVISAGKGAIFVTCHMGIWEIFGQLLNVWGAPPVSVYRPVKNPLIDRLVRQRRSLFGQRMLERDGALPVLLRILRKKGYIALLIDQHAKWNGTWVPFFGRLASTTPAAAMLALRTGAPIVTGYCHRLPGTYRFEVVADEPIYAAPTGDREADVYNLTLLMTQRIEGYIRQHPEQWLWMHRRWRKPPPEVFAKRNGHV